MRPFETIGVEQVEFHKQTRQYGSVDLVESRRTISVANIYKEKEKETRKKENYGSVHN